MRKKQLLEAKAAGKTVAYTNYVPTDSYPTSAREVEVVEVGVKRAVRARARSWSKHVKEDGVKVRPLRPVSSDDYHRPLIKLVQSYVRPDEHDHESDCIVVAPRELIDTWEDFVTKTRQQQEQRQTREQRHAELSSRSRAAADKLKELGFTSAQTHYNCDAYKYGAAPTNGVELGLGDIERIIELLSAK